MELMQFSRDLDDFQANHPKVAKFLQIEFGKGLPEGSILELKIQRPGEEEKVGNLRVLAEDERYTYRYTTPLPNLSPSEVAALLEIKQNDETKQYERGNLKIRVENGRTVLTCLFR